MFQEGNHTMTNKKCLLPKNSKRITKKGYEEVIVPSVSRKNERIKLIEIDSLPKWAQSAFPPRVK